MDTPFPPVHDETLPPVVMPFCPIEQKLKGQKALVTGASSGIGKGIAIGLGHAGADVVVNYIKDEAEAEAIVAEVKRCGANAYAHRADVSNEDDVRGMFARMFEEFGTITDRDYKVKKVGQGQGGSFVVTPLDKELFKNSKAKPYTYKQVKEIMEKAWVSKDLDTDDEDEEEDDEVETKKKKGSKDKAAKGKKKKKEPTLREKFEELSFKDLKSIALEIGMTKKELKAFDDEEELLDELFDNYEEEDLQELLDDMDSDDEEDDEDEEA